MTRQIFFTLSRIFEYMHAEKATIRLWPEAKLQTSLNICRVWTGLLLLAFRFCLLCRAYIASIQTLTNLHRCTKSCIDVELVVVQNPHQQYFSHVQTSLKSVDFGG